MAGQGKAASGGCLAVLLAVLRWWLAALLRWLALRPASDSTVVRLLAGWFPEGLAFGSGWFVRLAGSQAVLRRLGSLVVSRRTGGGRFPAGMAGRYSG